MVVNIIKKAKSALLADPKLLYEEESGLIKKPFYFSGNNGKAVLLLHGWTTVPYEVLRLGKYLNKNGYTVYGPLLRGHGGVPSDLEGIIWEDWMCDANRAYEKLAEDYEKIYIAGTSLGANLATMLAKNKNSVSGIVLMAMPYKIKLERITALFAHILKIFKKYNTKFYPPSFGSKATITRLISYQTYPIDSALEVYKLIKICRKELSKIKQPCLILQSNEDHIVTKNSLEKIYEKINSKVKEKKYINKAYHTFISDIRNEHVFEDILEFIKKN